MKNANQLDTIQALYDAECEKTAKMREALGEVLSDFQKHGVSQSNYSDGEYTQDYTTRKERIEKALTA
jgi:hypothetical protein